MSERLHKKDDMGVVVSADVLALKRARLTAYQEMDVRDRKRQLTSVMLNPESLWTEEQAWLHATMKSEMEAQHAAEIAEGKPWVRSVFEEVEDSLPPVPGL